MPCPAPTWTSSIAFYESIGFTRTYRQVRPNPYAVVALEDIHIHLFGIDGFVPADSYGTAIVVVPDPDASIVTLLPDCGRPTASCRSPASRASFGRGRSTARCVVLSVVDPGGNWLRISKLGETEQEDSAEKAEGLAQIVYVATRLGDAHGDEALALKTLESGLTRFGDDAPAVELARAYLYRAELAVRTDDPELARSSLAAAESLDLTGDDEAALADEFAHVTELLDQL